MICLQECGEESRIKGSLSPLWLKFHEFVFSRRLKAQEHKIVIIRKIPILAGQEAA
jgi:hypothetical protein